MTGGRLEILEPGLLTTVQDAGRFGYQDAGLPPAGMLDREAHWIANGLLGNPLHEAALEIRVTGPSFRVAGQAVTLALAGAGQGLEVTQADGGIFRVPTFQSLRVQAGERVRVLPLAGSVTAVLAVAGGFAVEPVMGSASTDLRSALGGFQGRALRSGDRLPVNGDCDPPTRFFPQPEDWLSVAPVRLVPGPQWDAFSEAAQKALFDSPFRISKDADRMGLRLEGPALTHRAGADIVSDGIATGALQVPGSGQPILLLADRQTAGGYAKIAHVASVDLPRLGRLPPGTSLSFSRITREEAENLRRGRDRDLRRALADCPLLLEGRHIDLDALYSANLVSGVVDGNDPDR